LLRHDVRGDHRSSLARIDLDGKVISPAGAHVNEAGFTVHSAIHAARPDVHCVIHTHTRAGMALSSLRQGLLPLCQKSMLFQNRLAYHAFRALPSTSPNAKVSSPTSARTRRWCCATMASSPADAIAPKPSA
jgi:ribulose-5-phosphate 4-epimerase/fuculose-1-phosphate aldolase